MIGAIQLYQQYHEYLEGEDSYTELGSYVELPKENFEIEIFAGYVVSVQDKAWEMTFYSDRDFSKWPEKAED